MEPYAVLAKIEIDSLPVHPLDTLKDLYPGVPCRKNIKKAISWLLNIFEAD